MKVLVINGSPKGERSNSLKLTKAFVDGMKEAAAAKEQTFEVHQMNVASMKIAPCRGCFVCWNKTPGSCCMSDEMQQVLDGQLWADVIIWSFPLYYYNVPGMLKNLIDRQLPMVLPFMADRQDGVGNGSHEVRYDMTAKKNVLISTCGFYTASDNYDSVLRMFDHICGKDNYETIFCGQGELFRVEELSARTAEYLAVVKQAGREFGEGSVAADSIAAAGIAADTKESLRQFLYPKEVFEAMADASWGISREEGKKEDEALIFTRQMAALYRKDAYDGKERVLEMCYTDLGVSYQIRFGKEGSRVNADCTGTFTTRIETPFTVWQSIARGEIRGDEALAKQLYRVEGDFGLMMKWDQFFGGGTAPGTDVGVSAGSAAGNADESSGSAAGNAAGSCEAAPESGQKGASMLLVLLPWIVFWIAVPIDSFWGALVGIAVCAVLPLLFYRHRKTIYDVISTGIVGLLAVLLLAGSSAGWIVPASYLLFGVMWMASCKTNIPLTAHYVMDQYNGADALKNPIFMDTNRILTFAWGILYVLTAVWTYFLLGTKLGPVTGAINSVVPVFMGIFTGWFQKWYPAWVARGRR